MFQQQEARHWQWSRQEDLLLCQPAGERQQGWDKDRSSLGAGNERLHHGSVGYIEAKRTNEGDFVQLDGWTLPPRLQNTLLGRSLLLGDTHTLICCFFMWACQHTKCINLYFCSFYQYQHQHLNHALQKVPRCQDVNIQDPKDYTTSRLLCLAYIEIANPVLHKNFWKHVHVTVACTALFYCVFGCSDSDVCVCVGQMCFNNIYVIFWLAPHTLTLTHVLSRHASTKLCQSETAEDHLRHRDEGRQSEWISSRPGSAFGSNVVSDVVVLTLLFFAFFHVHCAQGSDWIK